METVIASVEELTVATAKDDSPLRTFSYHSISLRLMSLLVVKVSSRIQRYYYYPSHPFSTSSYPMKQRQTDIPAPIPIVHFSVLLRFRSVYIEQSECTSLSRLLLPDRDIYHRILRSMCHYGRCMKLWQSGLF
jgi:hypothetical protein